MSKALSLSLVIGGVLGSSWVSSLGKANEGLGLLGKQIETLKSRKAALPSMAFNVASLSPLKKTLSDNKATLAGLQKKQAAGDNSPALAKQITLATNAVKASQAVFNKRIDSLKRTREQLQKNGIDTTGLAEKTARLNDKIRQTVDLQNRLGKFRASAGDFFGMLRRNATIAIGASTGLFALAKSASDYGDELAKTSARLGMASAKLQELRHAGELAGVGSQELDNNLAQLSKRLGEAMNGTGEAGKMAQRYGISLANLASDDADKRLGTLADTMNGITNDTERAAFANAFFGRSGMKMINMLKDGSGALRKSMSEAGKYGHMFNKEDSENAEKFNDNLFRLKTSFAGLKNALGAKLFLPLSETMQKIAEQFANNRETIVEGFSGIAKHVADVLPTVIQIAGGILKWAGILLQVKPLFYSAVGLLSAIGTAVAGVKFYRFGRDTLAAGREIIRFTRATLACIAGETFLNKTLSLSAIRLKAATFWQIAMNNARKSWNAISAFSGRGLRGAGNLLRAGGRGAAGLAGASGLFRGVLRFLPLVGGAFLKIGVLVKGVFAAVGAAIAGVGWPITLIVAAIVGAALLVWKYWEPIKKFFIELGTTIWTAIAPAVADIKGCFVDLWGSISESFGGVWAELKTAWAEITGMFSSGDGESGINFFGLLAGYVKYLAWQLGIVAKVVGWVFKGFAFNLRIVTTLFGWLVKIITWGIGKYVAYSKWAIGLIAQLFSWLGGKIADFFAWIWKPVEPFFSKVMGWFDTFSNFAGGIFDSIRLAWDDLFGGIMDGVKTLGDIVGGVGKYLGLTDDDTGTGEQSPASTAGKYAASPGAIDERNRRAAERRHNMLNAPALTNSNSSRTTTVTNAPSITINQQPGQDANALAREVMRQLNRQQYAYAGASLRDW